MVKLKKYNVALKCFVLFLTLSTLAGCASPKPLVNKVEGKQMAIDPGESSQNIVNYIKPYHDQLQGSMGQALSYAPQTLDKSGKWQSTLGNFFADITLKKARLLALDQQNIHVDFCLLNYGGMRAMLPKGNVTVENAFEIMPFENNLIIVQMDYSQIQEMLAYFIAEKLPHPISGIAFTIDKSMKPKNIIIDGKPLDPTKTYWVATIDYLYNGGDRMLFFGKGKMIGLNYPLRSVLLEGFGNYKEIPVITDERIKEEN